MDSIAYFISHRFVSQQAEVHQECSQPLEDSLARRGSELKYRQNACHQSASSITSRTAPSPPNLAEKRLFQVFGRRDPRESQN